MQDITDNKNKFWEDNEDDDIEYDDDMEYEEERSVKDNTNKEDLMVQDMADFLKVFGEYSRIKILECIMDIKYTVGDIACFTGLTQSAVCHHLKVLKQAKIVVSERSGRYVYYIVSDKHVKEIYNITRAHIEEFQKSISAKEEEDEMAKIFRKELYSEK